MCRIGNFFTSSHMFGSRMFKTFLRMIIPISVLFLSLALQHSFAVPLSDVLERSDLVESQRNVDSCEKVASIVGSAFFMNIRQQERGASENLLLQSYRNALYNLIEYTRQSHSNSSHFGEVCLTEVERSHGVYQSEMSLDSTFSPEQLSGELETPEPISRVGLKFVNQSFAIRSSSFHINITEVYDNITNLGLLQELGDVINTSVTFQEEVYAHMGVQSAVDHVSELAIYNNTINLFYFPVYLLPEGDIPAPDGSSRTNVLDLWDDIVAEMKKSPNDVSIDNIGVLPPTVEVFFDPFEQNVQNNFARLSLTNSQISGDQLLYSTSAIMLRAALAGIDGDKCLSILNHTAAFLFNAMRSSRFEGRSIQISPTFLPVYDEAFRRWTTNLNLSNAPIVDPSMVESIYHDDLEPLLYFNASANLNYLVSNGNETWAPINISEKLFDSSKLEALRQVAFESASDWRTVRTSLSSKGASRDLGVSVRDGTCPFGYVLFLNPAVQPQTTEEQCCAAVCEDLELILDVGLTTMSECCVLCNLDSCYVGDVDPLNGLVAITIEQYGLLEERVISVTI